MTRVICAVYECVWRQSLPGYTNSAQIKYQFVCCCFSLVLCLCLFADSFVLLVDLMQILTNARCCGYAAANAEANAQQQATANNDAANENNGKAAQPTNVIQMPSKPPPALVPTQPQMPMPMPAPMIVDQVRMMPAFCAGTSLPPD